MSPFQEKVWQNLDKLMLFTLFLVCMGSAIWIHRNGGMDEGSLDWARHNTDLVLAGLLGLMGGRAWQHITQTSTTEVPPKLPEEKQ